MLLRRKIECCWVGKKISKKRNIVVVGLLPGFMLFIVNVVGLLFVYFLFDFFNVKFFGLKYFPNFI
jgi:hypoxanthine-guanine phosphoribosyltransferase